MKVKCLAICAALRFRVRMKPDFQSYLFRVTRYLPLAVVNANQSTLFSLFSLFTLGKSPLEAACHVFIYGEGANLSHN